ncbi:MAG: hypothetical protein GY938_13145 [Ketobacter sp.]|nr:hypothetical protein [Ketobacter sp.]
MRQLKTKEAYILVFMLLMATISSVLGFVNTSMIAEKMNQDMTYLKEHVLITERDRVIGNNLILEILRVGDYPDSLLVNHYNVMAHYDSTRIFFGDHMIIEMTSDTTWEIVPLFIDDLH